MMNPAEFANIAKSEHDFWWYRGMRQILFRVLDPWARERKVRRALEAGCGTGFMAKVLEERYNWAMVPVDLGWEGLEFGRRMGVGRMCQANICDLPFPAAAFDAVVSLDVIVHLPGGEEDQPMDEFARVLAPGGLMVIRAAALDILRSRHSEFAHERQRFTRRRLVALAERHGIRVLRSTYANALLAPVALAKFRIWEPLVNAPPASGVKPVAGWLDRLLYAPLAAESALLGAGVNFPIGQSVLLVGEKPQLR
jgi:SAM-dependent methyltransferase